MDDLGPVPPGHVRLVIQDHAEAEIKPEPRILHIPFSQITAVPEDEPARLIPRPSEG